MTSKEKKRWEYNHNKIDHGAEIFTKTELSQQQMLVPINAINARALSCFSQIQFIISLFSLNLYSKHISIFKCSPSTILTIKELNYNDISLLTSILLHVIKKLKKIYVKCVRIGHRLENIFSEQKEKKISKLLF